jgi:hypothetical protein
MQGADTVRLNKVLVRAGAKLRLVARPFVAFEAVKRSDLLINIQFT